MKKAGELTGRGVAAVQAKAEREDWKGKASTAAKKASDNMAKSYEKHTGRNAKVDGTVAKVAGVAGAAACVAVAAPTVLLGTAAVGAAAVVANEKYKSTSEKAKSKYGEERAERHLYAVRQGAKKAGAFASDVGQAFAEGYADGKRGRNDRSESGGDEAIPVGGGGDVHNLIALEPTQQGETGWYFNCSNGLEEYWGSRAGAGWSQLPPPADSLPPSRIVTVSCPAAGCGATLRVPKGASPVQCPSCESILDLLPPSEATPVAVPIAQLPPPTAPQQ